MHMKRFLSLASAAVTLTSIAGLAPAAPWIQPLDPGYYITDLSYDGTAAAGNVVGDGTYETFRWTASDGFMRLGQASVPAIGVGGGSPDISYDGKRVSASILSSDYNQTLGLWDINNGWSEAFPPVPSFVTAQDLTYGSAWGLSGDGKVVTGYYCSNILPSRVQGCTWSPDGALTNISGARVRVNAASYNASVVAGWEDFGHQGSWTPTAWRNGVKYPLIDNPLGTTMAQSVNIDGSIIVGYGVDEYAYQQSAVIWRWNGSSYDTQICGFLPDTVYGYGVAMFSSVTDDGSIAVGSNRLAFSPNSWVPLIWTAETGLISGLDYIASLGLTVPASTVISDFQCISPDGSVISATGFDTDAGMYHTFLIHLHQPCPADLTHDWIVEDSDFVVFANAYDILDCADPSMPLWCPSDINRDGMVDDADFVLFAGAYDALLCS